ncbi:hypothetical protein OIC43_42565 [Streptomyces sp. NBC_00825]|uniref:hypothetical protein n=1 Tax=unclassified Streptomyces TaxID=2593676 RepID=UPI00224C9D22|nr:MULTISPECIES: hypothetical protein [unclassified Streptomyces]WTB51893.1 hypothetical protein OG832_01115 [Streptomyces sp. NBC_00826]WTH95216.1 hypothetical protein OIC43_42565 [Streptomyces sp. NBC_00825]WTI03950.1 hypothetical protein OHA23_42540 [Streptomyces sp. NBC_00822]MCX4869539.1 hypothetical protein [Streptomyces sp. NBC_00906]MCX4900778.1 hypothetical protein [Streptomyces sp. NBC_00892]
MSVTPAVHTVLLQAMDRLLAGTPQHSDGSLTVAALAREAGISRASAYRADDVLELFRQRIDERSSGPDVPATLRERICELQGEVREARRARHEEITDLRRSVDTLAQCVQALTLDNQRLRAELVRQSTIIALPKASGLPSA